MRNLLLTAYFLFSFAASVFAAVETAPAGSPSTPQAVAGLPPSEAQVLFDNQPILTIKSKILTYSPEDRAKIISSRLEKLLKDPFFKSQTIKVVNSESSSDIVAGDVIIMSVTDGDAQAEQKERAVLAQELSGKIRKAIEQRREDYSLNSILFGGLYTFLATLVMVVVYGLVKHFFPKIALKIESWRGSYIRSVKFQSFELLTEERIHAFLLSLLRGVRVIIFLVLLYFYIPLILSFFPWTHDLAAQIFDYILVPLKTVGLSFVNYLPKVFFLIVIVGLTNYALKFIKFLFSEVQKETITIPGFYHEWAEPTYKIVRFLIIAFSVVVAFPYLPGAESPAFKGVSVFLGVLFSFGSSSAISNIVAGVILTYMRAFRIGDRVKIAETVGDVVEKTLLVTRIRTIKNVDITVPNSLVLGSHITNFSAAAQDDGLILHTTVTIGYDAPWRQVHELLIAAAKATENILEKPAPFVLQTSLDDFYVSYQINAYTDKPSVMARTYSDLHQNIQEKFNEGGVEIMSPHYATLRDGNMTTIPESYLPENYKQPPFRVSRVDTE